MRHCPLSADGGFNVGNISTTLDILSVDWKKISSISYSRKQYKRTVFHLQHLCNEEMLFESDSERLKVGLTQTESRINSPHTFVVFIKWPVLVYLWTAEQVLY